MTEAAIAWPKKTREQHFQALIAQAQAKGSLSPKLDPAVVSFMVNGLMSDLGPFLQSKFAKRKGDWIQLPAVREIFDQVIEILKNGLGK